MISSIFYNGDGSTRIFPVTFKINGEDYVRVYVDNVEVIDRTKYDIINNSIVFAPGDIPAVGTDNIKIYVATSSSELGDLGAPLTDITNVANNLAEIVAVSTQVIPNLPEILLADNNATIATTQANLAIAAMNAAEVSEANAAAGATTATSQALIATTKATSASNSATSASNSATTATTKANEASASASSALTSANNANTSETMAYKWSSNPVDTIVETDKYSALHWATKAQQWASTVDTTNFVDMTTNQTIGGTKTFTYSPIVPNATTTTQVVNKGQLDTKQDTLVSGTSIKTINNTSLLGSGDISVVSLTDNETISGTKTFSSSPIVPTPTAGDNSTKVSTTAFTKTEIDNTINPLKDVPQNAQTAAYTLALTDRGKSIDVSTGGITITVPLNSAVAFPIGATITITNLAATAITIASSATLRQAGTANTGNRTLAAYGMATLRKVASDTWFISGAGLS